MKTPTLHEVAFNGLWKNNQALVALLGLCPLLAVTNTAINGLGLGLATLLVLLASNVTISAVRHWLHSEIRLPAFVLIIAGFVTSTDIALAAWLPGLHEALGIFVPLIVTNCTILARAEAFASRQPVLHSAVDALAIGGGFLLVLFVLGALREVIGTGSVLAGADLLFGAGAADWSVRLTDRGFLLAILPPGAFVGLGLLIKKKNLLDARRQRRHSVHVPLPQRA